MKKINILFISHSADLGGAEIALLDIITSLDRDKYKACLVVPMEGILLDRARNIGIDTFIATYKPWLMQKPSLWLSLVYSCINIIGIFEIALLIRKWDIDVIFSNTATTICGAIASVIVRKPHIWSIHEQIGQKEDAFSIACFASLPFAIINALSTRIIVNSEYIKKNFPQKYWDNISIVYNGFDINRYTASCEYRTRLRKKYNIGKDEITISIIGAVCHRKGQKEAVLALPILLKKNPKFRMIIVGGIFKNNILYGNELKNIIQSNRLEKNVTFKGFTENINDIYSITDYLIVPSLAEPFGRVIVEAMLFGIPVIASKTGGIPEIIQDRHNGLLVDSARPDLIAGSVFSLIDFPDKTKKYIENARSEASQRFNIELMKVGMEKVISEVNALYSKREKA